MRGRPAAISITAILMIAVFCILILGGLFYFGSDVYKTKADSALRNFSEWTPDTIAKYPLNYLDFCEKQTNEALVKLKSSEIAIAQKKSKLQSMRDETKELVDLGATALKELKELYKAASSKKDWPVTWRGNSLSEDLCKKQIVKINKEYVSKSAILAKYNSAVDQLSNQAAKVQESRDLAKEQIANVSTNREMLKIQEITSDLTTNLVAMKGVIETSVVAVAAEETGSLSISDLKAQGASVVSDDDFTKIMSK